MRSVCPLNLATPRHRRDILKRDVDLIRSILIAMENESCGFPSGDLQIAGFTDEQIGFHVYLLGQAGFARVADTSDTENFLPSAIPLSITWSGYEFLEAAKDENLWKKAKEIVIKPAGGVAFGVLVEWLKAEAKTRFGIPL